MEDDEIPHGTFSSDLSYVEKRIIVFALLGSWNIQTAVAGVEHLLKIANSHFEGNDWGILVDARAWGLCTPDVMEYFNHSVLKFTNIGLRWQAALPNNYMQKMVINQYAEIAQSDLTVKYFNNESDALDWLYTKISDER